MRFTDAELAAEYWCAWVACRDYWLTVDDDLLLHQRRAFYRFANTPSYDE